MHQTLRIPEILLNIFGHCSAPTTSLRRRNNNPDLAALARTCRTFKEPALDVLWEELHDLSPLIWCLSDDRLPSRVEKLGCHCGWSDRPRHNSFFQPQKGAEWLNTLRGYTCRVRSIHGVSGCVHGDTMGEIFSSDDPLFPHLRSLDWNGIDAFAPLHVAVPSLTMLHINLLSFRTVNKLVNAFGDRCPHIETLEIDNYDSSGLTHSTISRLVCCWPKLQQVVCRRVRLSMDAISHLSSVSTLKRLEFIAEISLIQDISHLGSMLVFSNLTYLDIGSELLDTIISLLCYIRLPAIETLYVEPASGYISRQTLQAYWAAVREACTSNVVTSLRLHGFDQDFEDLLPHDEPELSWLTLEDLRPCTTFTELRELHVNFNCAVGLMDTDLLELASPRMEVLLINDDRGWQNDAASDGITLSGLVQLLRRCPSLHRVCLAIDTRTFTEIPEGLDVSFPPRRRLEIDFVDSYILPEFVPGLVSVLAVLKLDPSMLKAWDMSCQWEMFEQRDSQSLWGDVLDGLENASPKQSLLSIV